MAGHRQVPSGSELIRTRVQIIRRPVYHVSHSAIMLRTARILETWLLIADIKDWSFDRISFTVSNCKNWVKLEMCEKNSMLC